MGPLRLVTDVVDVLPVDDVPGRLEAGYLGT